MGKKISSLKPPRDCLIVFAKEPQLGRVKTRLSGVLSGRQCLDLYKAFLKDTRDVVHRVACPCRILAYDSPQKPPRYLKKVFPKFIFYKQEGKDLGQRMHRAFQRARNLRVRRIVIIGSDSPTLPAEYIQEAFAALKRNDVVLGPSYDGGYYLIGLNVPCQNLFRNVVWSSDKVLKVTLRNAQNLGRRVCLLKKCQDIDDAASLKSLQKSLLRNNNGQAFWTKKFLQSMTGS